MRLCAFFYPFDEGGRETEFAAEFRFAGGHLAVVVFVVFSGEMQEAVKEEDANFIAQGMAVDFSLKRCGFERDGKVACVPCGEFGWRRKAKDVGGFVLTTEAFVQLAKGRVTGEEDIDCS